MKNNQLGAAITDIKMRRMSGVAVAKILKYVTETSLSVRNLRILDQQGGNPRDRRGHPRVDLDLPVEYKAWGTLKVFGGLAIDGSKEGLLIFSIKEVLCKERIEEFDPHAVEFELLCQNQ